MIAEPDERYETYCASSDFIREHIFPGGHLPSMGAMVQAARGTSLQVCFLILRVRVLTPLAQSRTCATRAADGITRRLSGRDSAWTAEAQHRSSKPPAEKVHSGCLEHAMVVLCSFLQVQGCRDIGLDYAITLRDWRAAWEEKREAVLQLGYSDRFWRKYR